MTFSFDNLVSAVTDATAFVSINTLMPAGGAQDRIHPPTFPPHDKRASPYLTEKHHDAEGQVRDTVVLDTVGSQANWLESGLQMGVDRFGVPLPCPHMDFSGAPDPLTAVLGKMSALEFSHRIADSHFRHAMFEEDGQMVEFFRSKKNIHMLLSAVRKNFSPFFGECPHALLFGFWDSGGPLGNKGPKVARSIVSEIIGWDAVEGTHGGIRRDPTGLADVGVLQHSLSKGLSFLSKEEAEAVRKANKAVKDAGKEGKGRKNSKPLGDVRLQGPPSKHLLGNAIFPVKGNPLCGGFTISSATQTVVINLAGIRALRFRTDASDIPYQGEALVLAERAARTLLAAMGLLALVLARKNGYSLRSRCLLIPTGPMTIQIRNPDGETPQEFTLTVEEAVSLYNSAVAEVKRVNLPWNEMGLKFRPSDTILQGIRDSANLDVSDAPEESS